MTPIELASASVNLLNRILAEAIELEPRLLKPNDECRRHAFVNHHAHYIASIGEDVVISYQQERYSAAVVAVRAMLESALCVVAAVEVESFAVEKVVAEAEKHVHNLNTHFKDELDTPDIKMTIKVLDLFIHELRTRHNITTNRSWNTYDVAQAAKLKELYKDYSMLCSYVHSSFSGIVSQKKGLARNNALRLAIGSILLATNFVPRLLSTKDPQTHIDDSNALYKTLEALIGSGAFDNKAQKV